ncbi:protocatechuate 3 [Mollisia scopiformis]|uniref:Protocatechuate 3 n=1 Tax=Mollisia scopiformis TaxID=149040 RepID=A0A194XFY8_MOLSC|nr:protocatechuate 3 [Mollisia scopiformis]KUJ19056.1 protocatechuate 3 [Mollisia scopiformis]
MYFSSLLISALLAPLSVVAHPGHHEALSYKEITRRAGLSKRCEGAAASMNAKRWLRHQERRSLAARANTTVVITTEAPYYDVIQNDTCVLTPEVTTGPYIWPQSQTLRQDMAEDQPGVPLYLDIGVLDTNTCEPLEGVLVDLWHCNATGSYSSFEALDPNTPFAELLESLNKTIGPDLDLHTGNSTFLRGMWPTDANGMMEMKTIFPGFYVQRAIHIHAQVHTNWVVGINGTIVSDETISTGQIFFAEDLSEQIMALEPYASHTQINRTTNAVDSIYSSEDTAGFDPVMAIVPLDGEDVTKGMVGYLTLGVAA